MQSRFIDLLAVSRRHYLLVMPSASWWSGRGFQFTDQAIEVALMLKSVSCLSQPAIEGLINSSFKLVDVPLASPDYSSLSETAKTVRVAYQAPSHGFGSNGRKF